MSEDKNDAKHLLSNPPAKPNDKQIYASEDNVKGNLNSDELKFIVISIVNI